MKPLRVLIFGSRTWDNRAPIEALLDGLSRRFKPLCIVEGCEPNGADSVACNYQAVYLPPDYPDVRHEHYPADWDRECDDRCYHKPRPDKCPAAGPLRNQRQLEEGRPHVGFGFIDKPLSESHGSKDMANRLREAGVPVYVTRKLT